MPFVGWPSHERTIVDVDCATPSAIIGDEAVPARTTLVPVGAAAPDFSLTSPGRGTISLADYRDHDQVLLVFMRAFG
jgi:hypothetical protein